MPKKVKVFISYAHADEGIMKDLDIHFAALKRSDKIEVWNDRQLLAGADWDEDIKSELVAADIILLLISADFNNSKYIWENELTLAMERHDQKLTRVIPIIIRPCDWQDMPYAKLQALPKDAQPVSISPNRDVAYSEIAKSIRLLINKLYQN